VIPGCGLCTHGWHEVGEAYAVAEANKAGAQGSPEWHQRLVASRNTVYPCKVCRPVLFYAWATGHLDPLHDQADCADCRERTKGKSATAMMARATTARAGVLEEPEPPPPPDEPPPGLFEGWPEHDEPDHRDHAQRAAGD
jgi:hypothetical protein